MMLRKKLQTPLSNATITVPQAGEVLGISRNKAYAAAKAGDFVTIRTGELIRVPTAPL